MTDARAGVVGDVQHGLHLNHCLFSTLQLAPHLRRWRRSLGPRPVREDRDSRKLAQTAFDFSTRRVTRQALVFEIGRHSAISTRSPSLNSSVSSCAWYFLRAGDDLAHQRVLHPALDQHRHRLLHLVADHPADQRALVLAGCLPLLLRSFALAFSFMMVRTRAMSRRTFFSWLVLVSCCVAFCMRRPNCAFSRSSQLLLQLLAVSCRAVRSLSWSFSYCAEHALHERGAERQLGRGEAERLARECFGHAVHLVEHLARLDLGTRSTPGCPCRCPCAPRPASARSACPGRCGSRCGRRA